LYVCDLPPTKQSAFSSGSPNKGEHSFIVVVVSRCPLTRSGS